MKPDEFTAWHEKLTDEQRSRVVLYAAPDIFARLSADAIRYADQSSPLAQLYGFPVFPSSLCDAGEIIALVRPYPPDPFQSWVRLLPSREAV